MRKGRAISQQQKPGQSSSEMLFPTLAEQHSCLLGVKAMVRR